MLKNVRTFVLGAVPVVGIAASGAAGQCTPSPPSQNQCPLGSQLHSTDYDVVIAEVINPVTTVERTTGWLIQDACNCFWVECDEPHSGWQECDPSVHSVGRQEQTCWSVSANVTVSGTTGLLAKLFGELGVSVTVGGSLTGCTTKSTMWSISVPVSNCYKTKARGNWEIANVTGYRDVAETVATYACLIPGQTPSTVDMMCNVQRINAQADDERALVTQFAYLPPECGGPDPVNPDHDGVTQDPCCTPLCDVPVGENPCCGQCAQP